MSQAPLYPSSGDGVKIDPKEVLDRSQGPTVVRMRLVATYVVLSADRITSLIRNCLLLGPHSRTMPRALRWS